MARAADTVLEPQLPATLRLGPVHLTVSTLDGSVAFYERALGLQLHDRDGDVATLGTGGEDLVVLVEEPDAAPSGRHVNIWLGRDVRPRPPRTAGLREWTVLLASLAEVAAVRARVAAAGLDARAHRGGFLVRDPWETAVGFRVG